MFSSASAKNDGAFGVSISLGWGERLFCLFLGHFPYSLSYFQVLPATTTATLVKKRTHLLSSTSSSHFTSYPFFMPVITTGKYEEGSEHKEILSVSRYSGSQAISEHRFSAENHQINVQKQPDWQMPWPVVKLAILSTHLYLSNPAPSYIKEKDWGLFSHQQMRLSGSKKKAKRICFLQICYYWHHIDSTVLWLNRVNTSRKQILCWHTFLVAQGWWVALEWGGLARPYICSLSPWI